MIGTGTKRVNQRDIIPVFMEITVQCKVQLKHAHSYTQSTNQPNYLEMSTRGTKENKTKQIRISHIYFLIFSVCKITRVTLNLITSILKERILPALLLHSNKQMWVKQSRGLLILHNLSFQFIRGKKNFYTALMGTNKQIFYVKGPYVFMSISKFKCMQKVEKR